MQNAQNREDKLQPLVQYLKDGTLPKDALTAEKLMRQESQHFLSDMTFYINNRMQAKELPFKRLWEA